MNMATLLTTDDNGDTIYNGPLGPAMRLAKKDRYVITEHISGLWRVEFYDEPNSPGSLAEWGAHSDREMAWRYALGAMMGPLDEMYDEVALVEALEGEKA